MQLIAKQQFAMGGQGHAAGVAGVFLMQDLPDCGLDWFTLQGFDHKRVDIDDRQRQKAPLQQQGQQVIPAEGGDVGQQGVGPTPLG